MKKKLVSCILVVCMLLTMLPTMAWAEEAKVLDIANGSITITEDGYTQGTATPTDFIGDYVITQTGAATATANTITVDGIADGKTITLSGVNMSGSTSMIKVNANATILLENANSVISSAGSTPTICIAADKTLTIDGTDSLTVKGGNKSAGIGGKGNLVINGGNISAVGKGGGAAIGGCYNGSYNKFGSITINDGTVTISKDEGAEYAGICPVTNATGGGDVIINGGKINISLKHAQDYAAIGGGKASNNLTGDVKINGGEITVDVTANANQYAIRTAGTFEMRGGTLVELKKAPNSTRDYITAGTVSITGGNVKEYYLDDPDDPDDGVAGRKLTKLYIVDANGTPVTSEVTITEGSHEWSAVPDANGVITTYLAEGTDSLTYEGEPYPVTPGKDSTIGVSCTCATGGSIAWTGVPAEITLYSGDASKTVAVSAEFVKASSCLAPVHPVDVVLSLTGAGASNGSIADGNLTLNYVAGGYELTLSAVAGTLATDTKTIKINCVTDKGLDIANGYVEVVAGTEAGKVTYKQKDGENYVPKYENVSASEPVTITGTCTFEEGNAIKITNCSPTIVLKDLTITGVYNNTAESNILIDGTANDHVKFILSGTNTLVRGEGKSENLQMRSCGLEIREATLTIDCGCEGESCDDKGCDDKLIVDAKNYARGAAIGSRYEFGITGGQPDGYTLNIEGGQIQANSNHFGAAIGTCRVSKNVLTNKVVINIKDGYVKAVANDDGVAIGAGRSDNPPNEGIVSVNISGGIVEAISKSLGNATNATSDAILASEVTASNGAEVTVSGNLKAKKSVEVKGTGTTLELKQKENLPEEYSKNPGGNICNGAEWVDSTTGETVVRPGDVQVKVSDGAALTTAGGINGSLTTSGNATANINGVAPRSGKASTDQNVGGVSGTVTVGAGSTVSVKEEIKGDVTVEGGATINDTDLPEDADTVTVPADKLDDVTVDANGTVTLPADSTITKEDGSSVNLSEGGTMASDGTITAGGTVTTMDKDGNVVSTVVVPEGEDATVSADGTVTAPAGTVVTDKDGKENTLTNGGTVDKDGAVTETPVTPPVEDDDPVDPPAGGDDPVTPPADNEGDKPTPQPPYSGYYPSYTPSVTPAAPSVDSSSLNNAALAVGSAIKDGSAEFAPVNGYTKDEVLQMQKDGKLRMGIEKKSGYGSVADKNLAEAAIKSAGGAVSGTSVMYFDITPVLKLDNGTVVAHVTDTEKAITISIELSAELTKAAKDGKDIAVVRVHDGKAEFLSCKLNSAKTKVTFSSADFSTYAVVALNKATSAKTFDAGVAMYVGMAVLAATGSAVVVGKKRK